MSYKLDPAASLIPSDQVELISDGQRYKLVQDGKSHELNDTAYLIWSLIDGKRSVQHIVEEVMRTFPELGDQEELEIRKTLETFSCANLVSSGSQPGSAAPEAARSNLVRYFTPTPTLIWELESLRQVISGIYTCFATKRVGASVDLSVQALTRAKETNIDTASSNNTSEVTPYKKLTESKQFGKMVKVIREELLDLLTTDRSDLVLRGSAFYPAGVSMGWHSNFGSPGTRVYCTWAAESHKNYFKFEDPASGDILTDWEPRGWTVKVFKIPRSPDRLWHCIHADSERFALGFGLMD